MNKVEDDTGFSGLVPKQEIYNKTRNQIAFAREEKIKQLIEENYSLREALLSMIEEKSDYMVLNNLGIPEEQHTIKLARAALAKGR